MANRPASLAHSAARHLIPRVWHVDPPHCPVCQNPMRVIAAIDDPQLVETILRHLALWHDPPPNPPRAWRGSRLSAGKGISGAVPAIGNEPDRSRVRHRTSALNLAVIRRAVVRVAVYWIKRCRNPRQATLSGFYDFMSAHNCKKVFSLVTVCKPSWLPPS